MEHISSINLSELIAVCRMTSESLIVTATNEKEILLENQAIEADLRCNSPSSIVNKEFSLSNSMIGVIKKIPSELTAVESILEVNDTQVVGIQVKIDNNDDYHYIMVKRQ